MIDTTTPLGRAVAGALRLAERRPWHEISLLEIADEAGLTLVELSRHVASRTAVLAALARLVDDEVLRRAERREPDESVRERLFDVVMTRFETLAPYRVGLRRIVAATPFAPRLLGTLMTSQAWMLTAAGISAEGLPGAVRVAGLASVYAATFRDWLADDDAGMAKTMAGLDRRLRRGEGWVRNLDAVTAAGDGMLDRLRGGLRWRPGRRTDAEDATAGPSPPADAGAAPHAQPGPAEATDADPTPPPGPSSSLH